MFRRYLIALTVGVSLVATAVLAGQGQAPTTIEFVVGAVDKAGNPVTDLKAEEIIFNEKAGKGTVTKFEPFKLPVKVTIAVDNGNQSSEALPHYRIGLKGFVEAFPEDVEMSIYTTSPQPRAVVRPTTDRAVILRGVNGFAPESGGASVYRRAGGVQPATRQGIEGFEGQAVRSGDGDGLDRFERVIELSAAGGDSAGSTTWWRAARDSS